MEARDYKARFLLCGFAFLTAWLFVAYYKPLQVDLATSQSSLSSPLAYGSGGISVLLLIAGFFGWRWVRPVVERSSAVIACIGLFAVGTLMSSFAPQGETGLFAFDLLVRLLLRISSTMLLASWMAVFARFSTTVILESMPLVLGSTLLTGAVFASGAVWNRTVMLCVAPFLTGGSLVAALYFLPRPIEEEKHSNPQAHAKAKTVSALLVLGLLVGLLGGISRYFASDQPASDFYTYFSLMLGGALLFLAAFCRLRRRRRNPEVPILRAEGVAYIAACVGLTLLLLLSGIAETRLVVDAFCRACVETAIIALLLVVARHYAWPPIQIFFLGQALVLLGNIIGVPASILLTMVSGDHATNAAIIILFSSCEAVAIIVFVLALIWRNDTSGSDDAPSTTPNDNAPESDDHALEEYIASIGLSAQEASVLHLIAKGRTRQRIAQELFLSEGSISSYTTRIYQKAKVRNKQQLFDRIEEFKSTRS